MLLNFRRNRLPREIQDCLDFAAELGAQTGALELPLEKGQDLLASICQLRIRTVLKSKTDSMDRKTERLRSELWALTASRASPSSSGRSPTLWINAAAVVVLAGLGAHLITDLQWQKTAMLAVAAFVVALNWPGLKSLPRRIGDSIRFKLLERRLRKFEEKKLRAEAEYLEGEELFGRVHELAVRVFELNRLKASQAFQASGIRLPVLTQHPDGET
ncbi:MAG TPA: hypothetical protein VLU25_17180 [Acidobacteriota bacterium]|nr:hypothetical protein [Acidobacteriota bacterium]